MDNTPDSVQVGQLKFNALMKALHDTIDTSGIPTIVVVGMLDLIKTELNLGMLSSIATQMQNAGPNQ